MAVSEEVARRIAANRAEAQRKCQARLLQQQQMQSAGTMASSFQNGLRIQSSVSGNNVSTIRPPFPNTTTRPSYPASNGVSYQAQQAVNNGRSTSLPVIPNTSPNPRLPVSSNGYARPPSSVMPVGPRSAVLIQPQAAPGSSFSGPLPAVKPPVVAIQKLDAQAVLVSRARFEIRCPYCAPLVELCKRYRTRSYDASSRRWSFDLTDYAALERAVRSELKDHIVLEGLPKFILNLWMKGSLGDPALQAEIDLVGRIPTNLLDALLPYQIEGVRFAVRNNGRILLADDMGLGKTIQAISVAVYFRDSWPVLCVCPSSMRFEWKEQWQRWVRELKDQEVSVITSGRQTDSLVNIKIAIITYDLLSSMKKYLVNRFPTVILDECHALKNYKAVRTVATTDVCKGARHLVLVSGTPALSKPSELFPQIEIINRSLFKNFQEFGRRYCNGHITPRGFPDYSGQSNPEELQILLESTIMIRRMKQDVAQQLPDKTRTVVVLDKDMVRFQDRALALSAETYMQTASSACASKQEIRGCLLNFYQHTGKAKVPAVIQYLKDAFEGNDSLKAVIFVHHAYVLTEIFVALGGDNLGIRIDGTTSAEARKYLCDKFQKDESCRFAVLSITACSSGITMTAASLVVFAELYWNPGILAQAEDRLHRLGQKNNVTVKYLVARDTSDDHMWAMLQRKLKFLNEVGLSRDNLGTASMEQQDAVSRRLEEIMDDGSESGVVNQTEAENVDTTNLPCDELFGDDIFDQMAADDLNESFQPPSSPNKRIKLSSND